MISPCQGCERRRLHCHADCDDYKEYAADRERIRRARYEESVALEPRYIRAARKNAEYQRKSKNR